MKQICSKCKVNKDLSAYSWRDKKKGYRHSFCKTCHTLYRRKHYLIHKEKYLVKARKWNRKQTGILRKFITDFLSVHACVDCGNNDLRVLDFDHEGDKKMCISKMLRNCHSLSSVIKEIEKCKVRCSNCHRIKTFERGCFWKTKK